MDASTALLERQSVDLNVLCPWERLSPSCHLPRPIDRFSNNETRIMINNFSLRGLILMKLKI